MTETRIAPRRPIKANERDSKQRAADRTEVVHRTLEPVGPPVGSRWDDIREERVACWCAKAAGDPPVGDRFSGRLLTEDPRELLHQSFSQVGDVSLRDGSERLRYDGLLNIERLSSTAVPPPKRTRVSAQGTTPSSSSDSCSSSASRYTLNAPAWVSSSSPYPPERTPTESILARRAARRSQTASPIT
jgi:hypothetical protein